MRPGGAVALLHSYEASCFGSLRDASPCFVLQRRQNVFLALIQVQSYRGCIAVQFVPDASCRFERFSIWEAPPRSSRMHAAFSRQGMLVSFRSHFLGFPGECYLGMRQGNQYVSLLPTQQESSRVPRFAAQPASWPSFCRSRNRETNAFTTPAQECQTQLTAPGSWLGI